ATSQAGASRLPSPSPHLILPGLQGQSPEVQRRREGDALYFECPYTAQTEGWQTKFWCFQKDGRCQEVVSTYSEHEKKSKDGRIKIEDKATNKTVFISMTDLKAEDSGTYFCAIYPSYNQYMPLRVVTLNVFKGEYLHPTQSKALSGSNIIPSPALPLVPHS
uniref:Ig-like domain-containing protein n=1 Tax=Cyanistes caeruleus TaxID=156563 RepID=A0A8C0V915_CYACU